MRFVYLMNVVCKNFVAAHKLSHCKSNSQSFQESDSFAVQHSELLRGTEYLMRFMY
jgi:hypothetical protein